MNESLYELDYEIIEKENKLIDFIDQKSDYYELWESSSIGDKFLYFTNSGFLYKLDSPQIPDAELIDVIDTLLSESENRGAVFRPQEVEKKLFKIGFLLVGQKGSHRQYENPLKKGKVTVSFHSKDIKDGTFSSILKQAQISKKEFKEIK
jgi:predicted RNA binding protein YcfA (HicA-like mRNA interferase family)